MAAEAHAPTASEYIVHHLQHLQNIKQKSIIDFSVFNLDSIAVSVTLGALCLFVLWLAARKATSGVPGRFQAVVEMLVEMVDNQAKANIHNAQSRKFIAPLALTVFAAANAAPVADFSANQLQACTGQNVIFTSSSTGTMRGSSSKACRAGPARSFMKLSRVSAAAGSARPTWCSTPRCRASPSTRRRTA